MFNSGHTGFGRKGTRLIEFIPIILIVYILVEGKWREIKNPKQTALLGVSMGRGKLIPQSVF
jgi:hypothetical protein